MPEQSCSHLGTHCGFTGRDTARPLELPTVLGRALQDTKGKVQAPGFHIPLTAAGFRDPCHHHGYWSTGMHHSPRPDRGMLPGKHTWQAQSSPQMQGITGKTQEFSFASRLTPSSRHWALSSYSWMQGSQVGIQIWD